MNGDELLFSVAAVGTFVALIVLAVAAMRTVALTAHAVGGVGAIHEALVAVNAKLQHLATVAEAAQGTNSVGTRLAEIEAKVQASQMVVADAVEKVTSLSSRVQTRVSRAQRERGLLDEDDDEPVTPAERAQALAQLTAAGAVVTPPDTGTAGVGKRGGSGWDRVRRTAAAARREA